MVPTLVIGLREGVEASLVIGIIAAFLANEGRRDALATMWLGVGIAIALCVAVAVALRFAGQELPEREQEGLATGISLVAVVAVTYMIVWMRRNARGIRASLEGSASEALMAGSALALVGMAFLAVLREGFETSVFLLAAFQDSRDPVAAGAGAVIGLLASVVIGIGLCKGGVRLNFGRFFRITGLVLVLVAAGLLAAAMHTAHEAGWLNGLQSQAVDLSWLVRPGTISGSMLTGMLGLQPKPTIAEAIAYVAYALPMILYVIWPDRRRAPGTESKGLAALGPRRPPEAPQPSSDGWDDVDPSAGASTRAPVSGAASAGSAPAGSCSGLGRCGAPPIRSCQRR